MPPHAVRVELGPDQERWKLDPLELARRIAAGCAATRPHRIDLHGLRLDPLRVGLGSTAAEGAGWIALWVTLGFPVGWLHTDVYKLEARLDIDHVPAGTITHELRLDYFDRNPGAGNALLLVLTSPFFPAALVFSEDEAVVDAACERLIELVGQRVLTHERRLNATVRSAPSASPPAGSTPPSRSRPARTSLTSTSPPPAPSAPSAPSPPRTPRPVRPPRPALPAPPPPALRHRPTVTVSFPATGRVLGTTTVTLEGVAHGEVSVVRVRVGSSSWQEAQGTTRWACTVSLPGEGQHDVAVRAEGAAGVSQTVSLTLQVRDLTPPTLAVAGPQDGARHDQVSVTLHGNASDPGPLASGVARVEARAGRGAWVAASGTGAWSVTLPLTEGTNRLEVRSVDGRGNAISAARTVYVPTFAELLVEAQRQALRPTPAACRGAVAHLERALARPSASSSPDLAAASYLLGRLRYFLGDFQRALADLERAERVDAARRADGPGARARGTRAVVRDGIGDPDLLTRFADLERQLALARQTGQRADAVAARDAARALRNAPACARWANRGRVMDALAEAEAAAR